MCRPGLDLARKLRHDLEQIADHADVGDLEDRRILVLVDRDGDLDVLHSGEMLDRAWFDARQLAHAHAHAPALELRHGGFACPADPRHNQADVSVMITAWIVPRPSARAA